MEGTEQVALAALVEFQFGHIFTFLNHLSIISGILILFAFLLCEVHGPSLGLA